MRVIHISQSDILGGAARAAYRLHQAQINFGIQSSMIVRNKRSDVSSIYGPQSSIEKFKNLLRPSLGQLIGKLQKSQNVSLHSGNWLPSNWAKLLNASNADIVHLHWVGNETMSIRDIGRIKKPIVWTLHDMWPFCGSEHITIDSEYARWRTGYTRSNKSPENQGLDLDRWVWLQKKLLWKQPMNIVAPSLWMADCAKNSVLFKDHNITVIPNLLDTYVYKPLDQNFCRVSLGLPLDKKIILFGAIGGTQDQNKGYDLLLDALNYLKTELISDNVLCVIFGQSTPTPTNSPSQLPFDTKWLGHINDDVTLALLYNAASVMVVPSRKESFGQTATEAQACGTPVVAFNSTGLKDTITHLSTGYLAQPYNPIDLKNGIKFALNSKGILSNNCRKKTLDDYSTDIVMKKYINLYKNIKNVTNN
ncbi:glycosyltransferase [Providencia rettgeri]|uniref:glycosyltransferase n=1 Tax=Providencia rettgeri TaxID=587 RepID=UPI001419BEA9|nr:glycosyltransferase [Providencia rettgeri]NIA75116.1 glycosyltransferase [Providencia rettgeri]NIA79425.1 glycosyltransferase [Providencia rettgeri]NIB02645.1 glycosyltransferase [Providencia rettgeri]NIB06925.1 glycosyltransferase [Providencia rettgeri]NIB20303.1 glycosyltransferase [Providencia rettgeri]